MVNRRAHTEAMATKNLPQVSGSSNNSDNNTISNSGQSNVGTRGDKNLRSINRNSVQGKDDDHPIFHYIRCNLCAREFDDIPKLKVHNMRNHHSKRKRAINGTFVEKDNSDNLQSMVIPINDLLEKDVPLVRNLMVQVFTENESHSESEILNVLKNS